MGLCCSELFMETRAQVFNLHISRNVRGFFPLIKFQQNTVHLTSLSLAFLFLFCALIAALLESASAICLKTFSKLFLE